MPNTGEPNIGNNIQWTNGDDQTTQILRSCISTKEVGEDYFSISFFRFWGCCNDGSCLRRVSGTES